ncbi:MAG: hypothetical protein VYB55_04230, partial [Bacteroidota bacterium]|nr:hypothetical protein [Bacteroidota bacterium]
TCLSTIQWYYGLDRQSPTGTIDFYATVVHELVHGLGFIDSIDNTTGAFAFAPQPYLFDTFLADRGWINKTVTDMTDGERLSAITSQSNLVWTGAKVTAKAAGVLSAGRHPSTGEVLMYGPLTASETSSVGHFDTSLTPDELMEPFGTPTVDDRLTKALLEDLGWTVTATNTATSTVPVGNLENPGVDSYKSGIGVISGWVCSASSVLVTVDGTPIQTAYGTDRPDTENVCGDTNNGFGVLYNWNRFGDGTHTAIAYADGVEFGRANFTVTTFGVEFLQGVAGWYTFESWPYAGHTLDDKWDQSVQNFVIFNPSLAPVGGSSSSGGNLESPGKGSHKSGIGVISGWHCAASQVTVVIDGISIQTGYGTDRPDTVDVCGDSNNGFGALYNWNRFGDGIHTAIAYADGVEFARANFAVKTFGVEFLTGKSLSLTSPGFPFDGQTTYVQWDEAVQNIVITDVQ